MHDHHGVSREMSFLATVLTVWLLGCGGVTHYENKVDPKRDLEKDRYECTRDAQSRAYTEVAYNDPEASSKRAMLEQNEFRLCMRSRGWAEVKASPSSEPEPLAPRTRPDRERHLPSLRRAGNANLECPDLLVARCQYSRLLLIIQQAQLTLLYTERSAESALSSDHNPRVTA